MGAYSHTHASGSRLGTQMWAAILLTLSVHLDWGPGAAESHAPKYVSNLADPFSTSASAIASASEDSDMPKGISQRLSRVTSVYFLR
eukprot:1572620-Rhodomonas_salina.1